MNTLPVLFCSGLLLALLPSCAVQPKSSPGKELASPAPDYSDPDNWAALPQKEDPADLTPGPDIPNIQASAEVDVFFLHPTTHTKKRPRNFWNAPLADEKINKRTDESPIQYQASIFNGVGKVYAPRYRQAHLQAYFTDDRQQAKAAFEIAYSDVKSAFQYYLDHYNNGRPIIIAAHSQGTTHGKRLVREFFDGKSLSKQLVAAYLVGIPVEADYFAVLQPCETPEQTECFCSWRTYKSGHYPKGAGPQENIVVTNPLSWTTASVYAPKTLNQGAVLMKFSKVIPQLADAKVNNGFLWITKPRYPGSFLYFSPNYHIGDFNLFYMNVRNNAILRARHFLNQ